jgi:uncharacterized protein involved in type VI secretion and phage assembly
LPDAFSIRISDPGLEHMDQSPFKLGAEVEIKFASPDGGALTSLFNGQVLTVQPDFTVGHIMLAARGYDYAHALHRSSRSETYQDMTVGDIAQKVAQRAGFQTGEIASGGGVHHFVQQSNETDWDFLWRLARRVDCEVVVEKRVLHFRKASAKTDTVAVRWGEGLTAFRPRVTGVQQVDQVVVRAWDPKTKQAQDSVATDEDGSSKIGVERSSVRKALGGGQLLVSDRPVSSAEEGDALARSLHDPRGPAPARRRHRLDRRHRRALQGRLCPRLDDPRVSRHVGLPDALHDQRALPAHAHRSRQSLAAPLIRLVRRRRRRDAERGSGAHGTRPHQVPGAR